ncbi:MAG: hypothetical protein GHCLOJNM_00210 [bacterium]|nr:hypothetical protein [bacterium]
MTRPHLVFNYTFHPVGQGLFASGSLCARDSRPPRFNWVYDCGTSSSTRLVRRGIDALQWQNGRRNKIDLVTLSHFDHDHISGVVDLLQAFRVQVLMLPYVPLETRLTIAFEEGVDPDDPIASFFVNPVEYLTAIEGSEIDTILLVLPSEGAGPEIPEGGRPPGPDEDGFFFGELATLSVNDYDEDLRFLSSQRDKVEFLPPGRSLPLRSFWEFVPYNDADLADRIPGDFGIEVRKWRDKLLIPGSDRYQALRALKSIYDDSFGSDSETRNAISLFLYGGPIYPAWERVELLRTPHFPYWHSPMLIPFADWMLFNDGWAWPSARGSVLYTGDGYLDTPLRLDRLLTYLKEFRISTTGVLQVMHHGSEHNWHSGVASRIAPELSVFSSDPDNKRYRHPHIAVLRDFLAYGPIQANKDRGVSAGGILSA